MNTIRRLSLLFLLLAGSFAVAADAPRIPGSGLPGSWLGPLNVGAFTLRLGLEVKLENGQLTAVLDSIDQNAKVPVTSISADEAGARFACASIGGSFEGRFSADGAELSGSWSQGGQSLPLTFRRLAQPFVLTRPQEPKKPYPYREEEVTFRGASSDVTLAGTLTLPPGKGPFPAVVLMTGSGPQDRDEALLGHKPFLVLADHLTRAGIAVLRYDDRGVARSTGNYGAATHLDFAADGRAAYEFAKSRPEIDAKHVGLLGHSEGSVYAPYIAKDSPDVDFVVLLAGVGVPMRELLQRQAIDIAAAAGAKLEITPAQQARDDALYALLATKKFDDAAREAIRTNVRESIAEMSPELRAALGVNESSIDMRMRMILNPWFVELSLYDPRTTLPDIRCPVLALFGTRDTQVAAEPNETSMRRIFAASGNRDVTLRTFPGLNHLFQHAKTGAPSEYGNIDETMAPDVLEAVSKWILEKTR